MIGRATACITLALAFIPSVDHAGEAEVFREAYPQCFRLFPDGSAERAACVVVLPWRRALDFNDDELTGLVRSETSPTPAGEEFRDLYPRCFVLFPEGSWDRRSCLDVSARHGYERYSDSELRESVEAERRRYEAALRQAEQRRDRLPQE